MKPIDNTNGSESTLSSLVRATAGALTTTLAGRLLGRPRPAQGRRAGKAAAAGPNQPSPQVTPRRGGPRPSGAAARKGGGRHG